MSSFIHFFGDLKRTQKGYVCAGTDIKSIPLSFLKIDSVDIVVKNKKIIAKKKMHGA